MSSSPVPSRTPPDVLEELQLHAAQNLEKVEISRYYEVIRELGKGTYGKVDLVVHRIRGGLFCQVLAVLIASGIRVLLIC